MITLADLLNTPWTPVHRRGADPSLRDPLEEAYAGVGNLAGGEKARLCASGERRAVGIDLRVLIFGPPPECLEIRRAEVHAHDDRERLELLPWPNHSPNKADLWSHVKEGGR